MESFPRKVEALMQSVGTDHIKPYGLRMEVHIHVKADMYMNIFIYVMFSVG